MWPPRLVARSPWAASEARRALAQRVVGWLEGARQVPSRLSARRRRQVPPGHLPSTRPPRELSGVRRDLARVPPAVEQFPDAPAPRSPSPSRFASALNTGKPAGAGRRRRGSRLSTSRHPRPGDRIVTARPHWARRPAARRAASSSSVARPGRRRPGRPGRPAGEPPRPTARAAHGAPREQVGSADPCDAFAAPRPAPGAARTAQQQLQPAEAVSGESAAFAGRTLPRRLEPTTLGLLRAGKSPAGTDETDAPGARRQRRQRPLPSGPQHGRASAPRPAT